MTEYSPNDMHGDWEFKILRCTPQGLFAKPGKLREVLAEEAIAGWELVEKFDDARIRLKRPTSRRQLDGKLEFDPYRTTVGMNGAVVVTIALGTALAVMVALFGFLFTMRSVNRPAQEATVVYPLQKAEKPAEPPNRPQEVNNMEPPRPPSIVFPSAK